MFLNQRQIWLLSALISDSKSRTSEEFAKKLLVTSRTIINDLSVLQDVLASFNITLLSKKGEGVSIEIHDLEKYQSLSTQIKKRQFNSGVLRSEFRERVMLIFRIIINKKGFFTLDEISNELFVSKNAILNEMRAVKTDLNKYFLKLSKKSHYGYFIEGKELHIRNAIIDSYEHFEDGLEPLDFIPNNYQFDEDGNYKIKDILIDSLKKHQLSLGGLFIRKVERTICVFEKRRKLGNFVEFDGEELSLICSSKIMIVVNEVIDKLELSWDEMEKAALGIHLLTMIEVKKDEKEAYFGKYVLSVNQIFSDLVLELKKNYNVDIEQYEDLSDTLFNILLSNKYVADFKMQERFYTRRIRQFSRLNPIPLELSIKTGFILCDNFFYNRGMLFSLVYLFNNYFSRVEYIKEHFLNISLISNYKKYSLLNHEKVILELFPKLINRIQIIDCYEVNEMDDELYICGDDQVVVGKQCIDVEYYYNREKLRRDILDKIADKMYDYSLLPTFTEDDIIDGLDINSLDELLFFLSSIFTRNTKESLKMLEYFKARQNFVSFDNEMNNILVIATFDQTIKGIKIIRLENPLMVRNYYGEYVIYLSLDTSDTKAFAMIKEILECIMNNPFLIENLYKKDDECKDFYVEVMKTKNGLYK